MSTNNTTSPDDSIPAYPTGGGGGSDGEAVMSMDSSSSSGINWAMISVLILWALGLVLLGIVLARVRQETRRRRDATSTNASTAAAMQEPDVEASNKINDQHEQQQQQQQEQADAVAVLVSSSSATRSSSSSRRSSLAIPLFSAVTAFCISIVPHTSCDYLELSEDDSNGDLLSLGLWNVAYVNGKAPDLGGGEHECYSNFRTAEFQVDTALTVARVAAILASTIGGICMLVLLYSTIVSSSSGGSKQLGRRRFVWPLLVAAFCQGLTLSIHASHQCQDSASCNVDTGAIMAITSTFYWFLCAVATTTI